MNLIWIVLLFGWPLTLGAAYFFGRRVSVDEAYQRGLRDGSNDFS
jgi:hypothetical protein